MWRTTRVTRRTRGRRPDSPQPGRRGCRTDRMWSPRRPARRRRRAPTLPIAARATTSRRPRSYRHDLLDVPARQPDGVTAGLGSRRHSSVAGTISGISTGVDNRPWAARRDRLGAACVAGLSRATGVRVPIVRGDAEWPSSSRRWLVGLVNLRRPASLGLTGSSVGRGSWAFVARARRHAGRRRPPSTSTSSPPATRPPASPRWLRRSPQPPAPPSTPANAAASAADSGTLAVDQAASTGTSASSRRP